MVRVTCENFHRAACIGLCRGSDGLLCRIKATTSVVPSGILLLTSRLVIDVFAFTPGRGSCYRHGLLVPRHLDGCTLVSIAGSSGDHRVAMRSRLRRRLSAHAVASTPGRSPDRRDRSLCANDHSRSVQLRLKIWRSHLFAKVVSPPPAGLSVAWLAPLVTRTNRPLWSSSDLRQRAAQERTARQAPRMTAVVACGSLLSEHHCARLPFDGSFPKVAGKF